MNFARQIPTGERVRDLSRFVDTPRQAKDPCFGCTLWDCDQTAKGCQFVNTSFRTAGDTYSRTLARERDELIAEPIADGVILKVRGNGFIERADDTETDADRRRRINREHMRRKRAVQKLRVET